MFCYTSIKKGTEDRTLNLNHLFYFRVLAQTENYTEAARQLRISQPSLSYAIKKLEIDIEVPLFEKKGRNVILTSYGKELQQTTEVAFDLIRQTTSRIQKQHGDESNTLTVGIVPTLASNFLPELIHVEKGNKLMPQKFQIFHGFTSDILEKVEQGAYDVGLCSKESYENLTFIPIKKQPFILFINKNLYEKEPNIQEKWFEMPLVTYRRNLPIGKTAQHMISSYTKSANIIGEFDDETSIGGYVSVNPCVAVVANTSLLKQFDLPAIELNEDKFFHTVYLVYQKQNQTLGKIKAFQNLIEPYSDF